MLNTQRDGPPSNTYFMATADIFILE